MIFSIVKKIKIHCRVKIYFNMYIPLDGVVVVLIPFLLTFSPSIIQTRNIISYIEDLESSLT